MSQNMPLPITAASIEPYLSPEGRGFYHVTVKEEVTSTNTVLKTLAADNAPQGTVLIARKQTNGRGRLGRSFHSPVGTGLYMSVLVRPTLAAEDALFLTTSAAVACAEAIDAVRKTDCGTASGIEPCTGQRRAMIKWVNDIYLADPSDTPKKVCGILAEAALLPGTDRLSYAVIGIGINLLPPPDGYPEALSRIAGSLFSPDEAAYADGSLLAASVLNNLLPALRNPLDRRFTDEYRARSLLDGRRVLVRAASSLGGAEVPAVVCGIDDRMGLCVRYDDGRTEILHSGEIVMQGNDNAVQSGAASVHLFQSENETR
ncbi:MAG: biotin--[acetyl-CoA-carboxylase] ligase [Eubacteriales bacterium]